MTIIQKGELMGDLISRQAAIETPFFDSSAGFMDDGTFQMYSDGAYDAVSLWNRRTRWDS